MNKETRVNEETKLHKEARSDRHIRRTVLALGAACAAACWLPAVAQEFPAKPITIVVPYAAGGPTDITARRIAELMSRSLGASVVVDNKPGASTAIGASHVARSPKDGYTLFIAPGTTTSINPHVFSSLPYKIEDFAPVSLVSRQPFVLTVASELPPKTVREFLEYANSRPDGVTFGTTGTGTMTHIIGEWIGSTLGVKMREVPYKGTSQSTIDLAGGRLDTQIEGVASGVNVHNGGKARVLAVMDDERSPTLPDVPTFKEAGFPELKAYTYFGLLAPAGTPRPVIDRLHKAVVDAVAAPDYVDKLKANGEQALSSKSPEQFGDVLRAEHQHWGRIIAPMNIKLN
jgi:tripartite-type tricarboxylate transporter receptor subunit TctC